MAVTTHEPWSRHLQPGAAWDPGVVTEWGSLPRRWSAVWAADPERPLLRSPEEGRWITAGELEDRTRRRAAVLHAAGIQPGDRVVCCVGHPTRFVEWHVGALRLGAVVVPTNPAYREAELRHIIGDATPSAVVVGSEEHAAWAGASGPHPPVVLAADGDTRPAGTAPALDRATAGDPALLPYTSGTTGRPKGALLTHGNLVAGAASLAAAWRWHPDDRLLLALPLFHMHGLGVALHGTLAVGASAVMFPAFDAAAVIEGVDEHRATLFFGVPTMYARLSQAPAVGALRRLRLCVSGSAPLPPELFSRVEQASGQRVLERYGMTETLMNLSNPVDGERRPGTVGFALPGVGVRLAGDGEIELRGPNVFRGYWRREEATRDAFTDDGWFRSGDLAEVDREGYHRIVGRKKELIISGGYNVYPREVEDALLELPGVREVAVVGRPSAEWGEIVTAFVVRDGPVVDEAAITEFCAGRLVGYKRPRAIVFVDQLPRNAMGKILRDELR